MLAGVLALIAAALFAGAAVYVGAAEHPARLSTDEASALRHWKPSYPRAAAMQGSLVLVAAVLGLAAAWQTGDWRWVAGMVLILANVPWTLIALMPTNRRLQAMPASATDARPLLRRWGRLHAARTVLGLAAVAMYAWPLA